MLIKKQKTASESGVFTDEAIQQGTLLFSHAEWIEDEKFGWDILTVRDIENLSPGDRIRFLRYSYDVDFGRIIGTFNWENARHISNFMNHSCDPNMCYDTNDNIIAKRDIMPGEELTIDYANFIVNVNQDFICNCGAKSCRRSIRKDDWMFLLDELGFNFPSFMHERIGQLTKKTHNRGM